MSGAFKVRLEAGPQGVLLVWEQRRGAPGNGALAQVCRRAGVPIGYARQLPPTLLVQNVNHGLAARPDQGRALDVKTDDQGRIIKVTWKSQGCGCTDPECPVHKGAAFCGRQGRYRLFRVDAQDVHGTLFCHTCADDAWDMGNWVDAEGVKL